MSFRILAIFTLLIGMLSSVAKAEDWKVEARKTFSRACEERVENYPVACLTLAKFWRDGEGGPKDLTMARTYFKIACEGTKTAIGACAEWGLLIANGEGGERDISRGKALILKDCKATGTEACLQFSIDLMKGEKIQKDLALALDLAKGACDRHVVLGGRGCALAAKIILDIGPESQDTMKNAMDFIVRGCDAGHTSSCDFVKQFKK